MLVSLKLIIFIVVESVLGAPLAVSTHPEELLTSLSPQTGASTNNDASYQNTGLTFGDSFNSGSGNQISPINSIGGISGTGISKAVNIRRRAIPRTHHKSN
jgi:hypothetical protein